MKNDYDLTDLYQRYYDKELYMIGALDCFGVPHTPDNLIQKSYIDMIEDDFSNSGIHVNYVNMHSIGFNKTWELKKIIDSDYTKKEYYDINLEQSKKAVATPNIFPFPLHPKFLSDYYKNPSNPDMHITSHFADSKDPIFFYSCGQMNFHQYSKMRTGDLKQIIPELAFCSLYNLHKTLNDVKDMIEHLNSINPSVKIYMFGVYPMFENAAVRDALVPIYSLVNLRTREFCSQFDNVYFVDVIGDAFHVAKDDCHPNFEGQCYMKDKVLKKVISTNKI